MFLSSKTLKIFLIPILLASLFGAGCKSSGSSLAAATKPIYLELWGVFDDSDAFAASVAAYRKVHSNTTIRYRKFRLEEYDRELINALAEDRGPDMFMVPNTAVAAYEPKIAPLPSTLTMPFLTVEGSIKKETVANMITNKTMTAYEMSRLFPDVVFKDAVRTTLVNPKTGAYGDKIFGIPFSVDTMALYYNKDLLNAAGIANPPTTWQEFIATEQKLTKIDAQGNLLQSGAAIGTSRNVERASDLLALIMMQNETVMIGDNGRAAFDRLPPNIRGNEVLPGADAVNFYTTFADPTNEAYTWNASQPDSLEAFVTGKTAFFFGYNYHLPIIQSRAPKLRFDIVPMPQIEGRNVVNIANYWLATVAKKSTEQTTAWDFITFATKAENVKTYLEATGKPTALRSLIETQKENPLLAPFVSQLLTAKSWYHGFNTPLAEQALLGLIDDIHSARYETAQQALSQAATKVNQTLVAPQ